MMDRHPEREVDNENSPFSNFRLRQGATASVRDVIKKHEHLNEVVWI